MKPVYSFSLNIFNWTAKNQMRDKSIYKIFPNAKVTRPRFKEY